MQSRGNKSQVGEGVEDMKREQVRKRALHLVEHLVEHLAEHLAAFAVFYFSLRN